ncbi:MAG: hypothetical protein PHW54_04050 [Candidatus Omnitrophica bacterium]|nr:hypothetical protein [Candidatus Omnitrophota bacterium]
MRDLLFKNLTSESKKRRILSSSETIDKQGIRSIIHRHFICLVKEITDKQLSKPEPYLYVLKERNTRDRLEKFFYRVKGSIYAVHNGQLFLVLFMHSLKISLMPTPQSLFK